jgi:hypothetical protein
MRNDDRMVWSHSLCETARYTDAACSAYSEIGYLDCKKDERVDLPRARGYRRCPSAFGTFLFLHVERMVYSCTVLIDLDIRG